MVTFDDRHDAGRQLATTIAARKITPDIVLAIPRGGLPLGREVADELGVPLDIVVARKIGAPHNSELAIGAVGSDGSVWLNDDLIARFDIDDDYLDRATAQEAANARAKAERYRGDRPAPDLANQRVVIVDDGVATGATMTACVRLVRDADASRVTVAVPVGPPDSITELEDLADAVVVLETPERFGAVGQYYRTFGQVSDEEAMAYLDAN